MSKDNKIEFNEILAYGDKKNVELGFPLTKGAKIEAELIKNSKERTVLVFKKRRRKNSRKKYGHRQQISLVRITKIFSKDGKLIAEAGPQREITQETVIGDRGRKKQEAEVKKINKEKESKIKASTKNLEKKAKKITDNVEKKKPLTAKKK